MDRFLAAATVAVVFVVVRTANNPLDLWFITGHRSTAVAVVYGAVAAVAVFWPRSPQVLMAIGAVGVAFWSLRSLDLLLTSMAGGARLWTASAVHALLAAALLSHYAGSIRREAFWAAADRDRPEAAAHG